MKCFFFSCMIILCPCLAGAQSFPLSRMYPFNPGTYAGDSGRYLEAQVRWILPVSGMQDLHAEAGCSWKNARWVGRIKHFGDALYREASIGLVGARQEGKVRLGAGLDYVERRIGAELERRSLQVDLGMWALLPPRLELGLHVSGPVAPYFHLATRLKAGRNLVFFADGDWRTAWILRLGLLYRIRPRIWFFTCFGPQTFLVGLALKSSTYGMSYSLETRPYSAYVHHLGVRYESYP